MKNPINHTIDMLRTAWGYSENFAFYNLVDELLGTTVTFYGLDIELKPLEDVPVPQQEGVLDKNYEKVIAALKAKL